jgi:tRNA A37 threonylcarbamoyladenosine dehydratase
LAANTYEDPLARSVRRRLWVNGMASSLSHPCARKIEGINSGIPVVYSTEKPNEQTALLYVASRDNVFRGEQCGSPLDEEEFQKGAVAELSALEDFRVRILPCLGWFLQARTC